MENKKKSGNPTFKRNEMSLFDTEKIKIIKEKIKKMEYKDLMKIPLYQQGDGLAKFNNGDLIRYNNGSILYIVENQQTKEKIPTLISKISIKKKDVVDFFKYFEEYKGNNTIGSLTFNKNSLLSKKYKISANELIYGSDEEK